MATKKRWIWIVLADGRTLRHLEHGWYHGEFGDSFASYAEARKAARQIATYCADMMPRVQHAKECVERWKKRADSIKVVRIALPKEDANGAL